MILPEILAPAGSPACALAAFEAGADAIYAGLSKFNARERGENFTPEVMAQIVDHAHKLGMRVLLDLVFAHCGPSAKVLKEHPEYFLYDENGKLRLTRWNFPMFDTTKKETCDYFMSVMKHYMNCLDIKMQNI